MAVLFVEISCEEIPARMQKNAIAALERNLTSLLTELGFSCTGCRSAISPRHMAVEIDGLEAQLADSHVEKRGPRTSAPEQAVAGFCQSAGLSRDALEVRATDKGEFFFAVSEVKGAVLEEVLPSLLQRLIAEFPWPKSQRWGHSSLSWVRPLHHIAASIDGKAIAGELAISETLSQPYATQTHAHPFHATQPVSLQQFDQYVSDMKDGFVLVSHTERRDVIAGQLEQAAAEKSLALVTDEGLLDEITGLVEWPQALCGQIDDEFMRLPSEVLITSMRVHQKFFATTTDNNRTAAPYFITVANRHTDERTAALIIKGNERVLRARLADAAFFWEQDKQTAFSDYLPKLEQVTFYEKLGHMRSKADRISKLAGMLAPLCGGTPADAERAGLLAKADLVTGMVGEFPELQGIMGGYYAAHHGESEAVSAAIAEHYRPQGPEDDIPQTPEGCAVALADKIDTLVGFFGVGAKPTGSRDPFALRRAALGILRIMDEASVALQLEDCFEQAAALHGFDAADTELAGFMADRLRVRLRDKNIPHDIVTASMADTEDGTEQAGLLWQMRLATALQQHLSSEQGKALLYGYRRFASLLAAEQKKTSLPAGDVEPGLFEHQAEEQLFQAMMNLPLYEAGDLTQLEPLIAALADLKMPIHTYFEEVVVNSDDENLRINRLKMLNRLHRQFAQIADFSAIENAS